MQILCKTSSINAVDDSVRGLMTPVLRGGDLLIPLSHFSAERRRASQVCLRGLCQFPFTCDRRAPEPTALADHPRAQNLGAVLGPDPSPSIFTSSEKLTSESAASRRASANPSRKRGPRRPASGAAGAHRDAAATARTHPPALPSSPPTPPHRTTQQPTRTAELLIGRPLGTPPAG